jgi:hypothetical protein
MVLSWGSSLYPRFAATHLPNAAGSIALRQVTSASPRFRPDPISRTPLPKWRFEVVLNGAISSNKILGYRTGYVGHISHANRLDSIYMAAWGKSVCRPFLAEALCGLGKVVRPQQDGTFPGVRPPRAGLHMPASSAVPPDDTAPLRLHSTGPSVTSETLKPQVTTRAEVEGLLRVR